VLRSILKISYSREPVVRFDYQILLTSPPKVTGWIRPLHKSQFTVLVSCSYEIAVRLIHSFGCKCRLRKPGVNCSTISLCCVTITWRYIFKGSLQVTEVAVLPRVARLGFLTPNSANFVFLRHLTSKKLFAFLAFSFQYLDYSEAVGL